VPGQDQLFTEALDRIRALPGVQVATVIRSLPFGNFHVPPMSVSGRSEPPAVGQQPPFLIAATPELFDILGVAVIEGRRFTDEDERGELAVIVNQTMARSVWPGESALGKCIRIGFDDSFDPYTATGPPVPSAAVPCRTVVGVARDVRQRSVVPTGYEDRLMQYYVPFSQVPPPPTGVEPGPDVSGLLIRTAGDPSTLIAPVRRLLVNGRTDLPYVQVRPYEAVLDGQLRPWRVGALLLSLFGTLALAVVAIGLYAAFAHAVAVRRREMAIRVAVGATSSNVMTMILREASALAAAGILGGGLAAVAAGRSLESVLYGIVPADPIVLGAAAALMLMVALAATLIPARTASRTNPAALLRSE
jgi:putative ABC transport system permease protein